MNKRIRVLYLVVLVAAIGVVSLAGVGRPHERAIIQQLLELPAPTPTENTADDGSPVDPNAHQSGKVDSKSPEALLGYWSQKYRRDRTEPSDEIKRRLFQAVANDPEKLPGVLGVLADDPKIHAKVKELYESAPKQPWFSDHWKNAVHDWLMLNSEDFRSDLFEVARAATDDEDGWVINEEELAALARLDWSAARPILDQHVTGGPSRVATYSLSLRYEHAVQVDDHDEAGRLRETLQGIAADRTAHGYSRDRAIDTLVGADWEGRDQWYMELMQDDSLLRLKDGIYSRSPLNGPVVRDPDVWIPRIAALVGHENRAVHDQAVNMLIQFQLKRARADALMPLLPWLFDPEWSSARDRLRLIQSVDGLDLRGAIPGLIHVVETEDGALRGYAAGSLASFKAKEAVSSLRYALTQDKDSHHRRMIIIALLACEGLTVDEMAQSIEAYAVQLSTAEGREAWEEYDYPYGDSELVDPQASIGAALGRESFEPPSGLADRLSSRLPELERKSLEAAGIVRKIMSLWSDPDVDRTFVRDLEVGKAGAEAIAAALQRREGMRANVGSDLSRLIEDGGLSAGVAAVILGEPITTRRVLGGESGVAKAALLASARLVREPLTVSEIGDLLGAKDALLSLAAERYLEADDSPEARRLVLERHGGQARILGARMSFDPGHATFGQFEQLEDDLRREVLAKDGPEEVYALLSAGYWGSTGHRFVRLRDSEATLSVCTDAARCHERALTGSELNRLTTFLDENSFEDLGPLDHIVHDGMQFEYVHVSPAGGRRVFMNNPNVDGGSPYDLLTDLFFDLERAAPLKVRYHLEDRIDELEVVLHEEHLAVRTVCGEGDTMAVLVAELGNDGPQWRDLRDDRLGQIVAAPSECHGFGANVIPDQPELEGFTAARNAWQTTSVPKQVLVGNWEHRGLWTWDGVRNPTRLIDGWFGGTVVTTDGNWAVAARAAKGENWGVPNRVVRIDVATGKEYVLDVPPADWFAPITYLPELDRVLLKRMADDETFGTEQPIGPEEPEYRLLDPSTGNTEVVSGEFAPMEQETFRALQLVSTVGDDRAWVWVAIPDHQRNTTVGFYDATSFTFVPQETFPSITFDSADMWVAAISGNLYVAYQGDLLRLPLKSKERARELDQAGSDADE